MSRLAAPLNRLVAQATVGTIPLKRADAPASPPRQTNARAKRAFAFLASGVRLPGLPLISARIQAAIGV